MQHYKAKTQPVKRRESKYNKFVAFIYTSPSCRHTSEGTKPSADKQTVDTSEIFKKSTISLLSDNYLIFRVNCRKYNYNVNIHYLSEKVKLH